jgi:hypothetical protein
LGGIVGAELDRDGVLHEGAKGLPQSVGALRLVSAGGYKRGNMLSTQHRRPFVAVA